MGHAAQEQIPQQGYAVFDRLYDEDEITTLRRGIEVIVRGASPPAFYAEEAEPLTDAVMVTPTGVAIRRLLSFRPDLVDLVLKPALLDALRAVLGPEMRLELAGAVVSDSTRPFFRWHTHIGGEDETTRYETGNWPKVQEVQRVLTLAYLQDLDEDGGPLLVLPRKVGDDTAPPAAIDEESWPGQVEIRASAGSLVALEQCTWHAAYARRRPGWRVFVGCYFASATAPAVDWADPSLRELAADHATLAGLVG